MYCLRYITAAKIEQYHFNISKDILDFVIYLCTETTCDQFFKRNFDISGTREDIISETKTPVFFTLKGLSDKCNLVFT